MYHNLDKKPNLENVLCINEPDLTDGIISYLRIRQLEMKSQADNIRVYSPLDLVADAFMLHFSSLVFRYYEANEENDFDIFGDVLMIIKKYG